MQMFKQVLRILGGVAVALFCGLTVSQPAQVDRPLLKPGTEWVYKIDNSKRDRPAPNSELKRVIKDTGTDEYTIELSGPTGTRTTAMSLDLNPFSEGMTTSGRASGALPYFLFPLAPGKTYAGSITYPSPFGSVNIKVDMNTKVLEWEDVTVPAGKYKALKIEANGKSVGGPINGWRKVTLWYAPEVANYVRMEFELSYSPASGKSVQELVSFSLKQ